MALPQLKVQFQVATGGMGGRREDGEGGEYACSVPGKGWLHAVFKEVSSTQNQESQHRLEMLKIPIGVLLDQNIYPIVMRREQLGWPCVFARICAMDSNKA